MTTDIDPTPSTPDNLIPPDELEFRRRVLSATEQLADLGKDMMERVRELRELDVPAADWVPLVLQHAPPMVQTLYDRYGGFLTGAFDGFFDAVGAGAKTGTEGIVAAMGGALRRDHRSAVAQVAQELNASGAMVQMPDDVGADELHSFEGLRMKRLIDRLFAQAPKLTDASGKPDPTQAPALECHVMLKAGGAVVGSLSVTPEGMLRMLSPNQAKGGKPVMIEHFFDYEQVADIAVFREISATAGSGIITS